MQVICPNCRARYAVDPLAIGPAGRTVQCARCSHQWRERATAEAVAAAPPPPPRLEPPPVVPPGAPPSAYKAGLPALTTQRPRPRSRAWLAGLLGVAVVAVLAVFAFAGEIADRLPPQWRSALDPDTIASFFRH